jgi:hypothetical protein
MIKYKYHFKSAMLLPILLITLTSFSQKNKDTVAHIYKYPVKEGYIYFYKENSGTIQDPAPFVSIYSKESDVVALMGGRVKRTFNVEGDDYVMIIKGDTGTVYGNMDSIYKKVGDTIHKGDLIGKIKKDVTYERYELVFGIIIGKKSMVYPEYINFLKQYK